MQKAISWIGDFQGSGAWPTINRHLTAALEKQGYTILRNVHNIGDDLTPIAIFSGYPVKFPNVRHALNLSYTSWEFDQLPSSFIKELNQFDLNIAASQWTAGIYERLTATPATFCHHGFDPAEFNPHGEKADFEQLTGHNLTDKKILLWVGGTDKRHGFDVAVEVMKLLPEDYVLVAKQSIHYPPQSIPHERVFILRQDFESLAPLYRGAYALLHTARAVGFSLPVLEAMACDCPVISDYLPPLAEVMGRSPQNQQIVNGGCHHIYPEVEINWIEPDAEQLAEQVLSNQFVYEPFRKKAVSLYSWDAIARRFSKIIEGAYAAIPA